MTQPLATFQVDMVDSQITLPPGQMVTPMLRYRAQAIAGWGTPNTEFSEPTNMGLGVPGNPYNQLVALYDMAGNVLPGFTTYPWQNGHHEGFAVFKILSPQTPGGNYVEFVLRATDLHGIVSGTGMWCKVFFTPVTPPPQTHTYEIRSGNQSLGSVQAQDPVTIYQDGRLIYSSTPQAFTNPITGGRTGNW